MSEGDYGECKGDREAASVGGPEAHESNVSPAELIQVAQKHESPILSRTELSPFALYAHQVPRSRGVRGRVRLSLIRLVETLDRLFVR